MRKEKYVVLCNDGGNNYDVAMFRIYTLKAGILKFYIKLNKYDYVEFVKKNKDYNIELYLNNSISEAQLDTIDERAMALKYSARLYSALKSVNTWFLENYMQGHPLFSEVSDAINKVRRTYLPDDK